MSGEGMHGTGRVSQEEAMPGGNLRGATPPTDGESGDLPCVDKRDTKADRATPALPASAGFVVIRTCPTGPGFGLTG
jgi:hypothetical protein